MVLAPFAPVCSWLQSRRKEAIRCARTCYDHIAGRLGVDLTRTDVCNHFRNWVTEEASTGHPRDS